MEHSRSCAMQQQLGIGGVESLGCDIRNAPKEKSPRDHFFRLWTQFSTTVNGSWRQALGVVMKRKRLASGVRLQPTAMSGGAVNDPARCPILEPVAGVDIHGHQAKRGDGIVRIEQLPAVFAPAWEATEAASRNKPLAPASGFLSEKGRT